jgi:hypothetical protein
MFKLIYSAIPNLLSMTPTVPPSQGRSENAPERVLTTFPSYGDVSSYRQAEIIRAFEPKLGLG